MASIDVPCANPDCDSEDIELVVSVDLGNKFGHQFYCNDCKTSFQIITELQKVKIPKEITS